MTALPLGLYVHLPWCVQKCPYCDFNSHALRGNLPEVPYLDAVMADLARELHRTGLRPIETVFFGGGTPSLISPTQIERVLRLLRDQNRLAPGAEITLEANPGTTESKKFADYRAIGINRLSVGVQSFDNQCLKALGRIHDADQARNALQVARDSGFERINVDLMYGLPGQSVEQAVADVAIALAFDPGHISQYQLTLEPGTVFYKSPPRLPGDDSTWDMMQRCQQRLQAAGYERYEVSALARPGQRCAHNLNYWQFGDYLGVGAGAHGKITDAHTILRSERPRPPIIYMQQAADGWPDQVVPPELAGFEFMLNALRLVEGFETSLFEHRTGRSLETVTHQIRDLVGRDLLSSDGHHLRPTERGFNFLNDLQQAFLPETRAPASE